MRPVTVLSTFIISVFFIQQNITAQISAGHLTDQPAIGTPPSESMSAKGAFEGRKHRGTISDCRFQMVPARVQEGQRS